MEEFIRLGFTIGRQLDLEQHRRVLADHGIHLPHDYLEFMALSQPASVNFGFKFLLSSTKEEWEGQITEFTDFSHNPHHLLQALIDVHGSLMLPIAVDAGGNNIMLSLSQNQPGVYDLNYSDGFLSEIAKSFSEFAEMLYPLD